MLWMKRAPSFCPALCEVVQGRRPPRPPPLLWPAIEASNDLSLPDRDRREPQPRSIRENPLHHRFHFTLPSNTSAIDLLDLTILPPGLFNHWRICWLRSPHAQDNSYLKRARSAAIHPFLFGNVN